MYFVTLALDMRPCYTICYILAQLKMYIFFLHFITNLQLYLNFYYFLDSYLISMNAYISPISFRSSTLLIFRLVSLSQLLLDVQ